MFDKQVYIDRRNKLRKSVKSGIILILGNSESPANYGANTYHFRQDSNFLYFFGLNVPDYVGVMDIEADTDCIYADDVTIDDIIWMGPQPTVKELAQSVGVKSAYSYRELYHTVLSAIKRGRKIHFLPAYRPANLILLEELVGIDRGHIANYVSTELIEAVVAQREIKDRYEIDELDSAAEVGYLMHTTTMKMCRPGIYEREIAGAIEGIALQHGAGVSFHSIVSQNGETLHNHYHGNRLESGRMLLCDAGSETVMNYCSDYTRTMPVSGKFTDRQKDVYNIVLAANNRAQELIRPGITYQQVHLEASKVIAEGLIGLGLLKGSVDDIVANGAAALFFPHGLGHQMGLDVHDMEDLGEKFVGYNAEIERSSQFGLSSLRMGKKLKDGMVITVEPGLYFIAALIEKWEKEKINTSFVNFKKAKEYIGFGGIRLEDDILVRPNGNRLLGKKRVPITVEEIEAIVGK